MKEEKVRLLFLASDPKDAGYHHRLGEEIRKMKIEIGLTKHGSSFNVRDELAVTPGDLQRHLLDFRPHIFHCSSTLVETMHFQCKTFSCYTPPGRVRTPARCAMTGTAGTPSLAFRHTSCG
jgi:hypothetical protein